MLATAAMSACNEPSEKVTGHNELAITDGVFTPDILNSMGRVSDPQVSPDGRTVLYGVSFPTIEENRSNRELFMVNIGGSNNTQITHTPKEESNTLIARMRCQGGKPFGGRIRHEVAGLVHTLL